MQILHQKRFEIEKRNERALNLISWLLQTFLAHAFAVTCSSGLSEPFCIYFPGQQLWILKLTWKVCKNILFLVILSREKKSCLGSSSPKNLNEKLVKSHLGEKVGNIPTRGPIRGKTFTAKIFLSGPVSMEFEKAFEVLKQFLGQTKHVT